MRVIDIDSGRIAPSLSGESSFEVRLLGGQTWVSKEGVILFC